MKDTVQEVSVLHKEKQGKQEEGQSVILIVILLRLTLSQEKMYTVLIYHMRRSILHLSARSHGLQRLVACFLGLFTHAALSTPCEFLYFVTALLLKSPFHLV